MSQIPSPFRHAVPDDVEALLPLAISTAPGFVETLWARLTAEGEAPEVFGRRVQIDFIDKKYTIVAESDKQIAAMLISFPIEDKQKQFVEDVDEMLAPVTKLYATAPGIWYIHMIATSPEFQGHGLSSKLMRLAEEQAIEAGYSEISLLVTDNNENAIQFYRKRGFAVIAQEPLVRCGADTEATQWLLMLKSLSPGSR